MNLRLALRTLLRRPGFSLLAIGALALGVGVATAVYSLVHNVLVEGLPFDDADRIVTPDVRSPQELGVRLAVGATPGDVLRLVARYALVLAGVGAIIGIAGASDAGRPGKGAEGGVGGGGELGIGNGGCTCTDHVAG